ncbi:MAG: site-specific DNA-methyltransferase [Phycisphaerales bacterium]
MAKKKRSSKSGGSTTTADYRHTKDKRANNPPAKIAAEGVVPALPKARYAYSPHRPPTLRFDPDGEYVALLEKARQQPLSDEEAATLRAALEAREPWLEWAEKAEQHQRGFFEVDPVALHIHERVSAQAILRAAARQDVERTLFADPQQEYHEAVQFYKHQVDWSNRLILGDSLQVMSSLARRENLAGKVQCIYIDPPYGIKFASNFQPEVGKRDVKDKQEDLTREPEMVRAYRDTWHLGIHSYLSYLRDRLTVARELLADSGSVFVQISDENEHRVRMLMDEVFGPNQFVAIIAFVKTGGFGSSLSVKGVADYLIWYCRDRDHMKLRRLYSLKNAIEGASKKYNTIEFESGECRTFAQAGYERSDVLPERARVLREDNATSQGNPEHSIIINGVEFSQTWKTNPSGLLRLRDAERLTPSGKTASYIRYIEDFPASQLTNVWSDIGGIQSRSESKLYVVQTAAEAVKRCMLMTTDPGDLVLDPTCGSGTTASVAEQWGRRWITIDTSRVAVAVARQRLLTDQYEHYRVANEGVDEATGTDPNSGFVYNTVPHVKLGSIAQDTNLDPIFAKHQPILDKALAECNAAITEINDENHLALTRKLGYKIASAGWRGLTHGDERQWLLPGTKQETIEQGVADGLKGTKKKATAKQIRSLVDKVPSPAEVGPSSVPEGGMGWEHWQVPFEPDGAYPKRLADAVTAYRKAWRAKMDEVNACIEANATQEELVDQPEKVPGVVRVSGPFTVEAVQPPEMSLGDVVDVGFGGEPEELEAFDDEDMPREIRMVESRGDVEAANAAAYLRRMFQLIRDDGVRFPNNKHMAWASEEQGEPLTPLFEDGRSDMIHAQGQWMEQGEGTVLADKVAVAFGPQYGPVTAKMVEDLVRAANRAGYDALVIAGFSFDGMAQSAIEEAQHPNLKIHMSNISPTANPAMDGLLKDPDKQKGGKGAKSTGKSSQQLFTVFGQPRVSIEGPDEDGEYVVTMEGVDIYDPVSNTIEPTGAKKVAAWFLDGDYDGRTFCITQAFFPDRSAWEKLAKALGSKGGGVIDDERFEALAGTESLPFPPGKHKRAAVKVIDPRGNEVMKVVGL